MSRADRRTLLIGAVAMGMIWLAAFVVPASIRGRTHVLTRADETHARLDAQKSLVWSPSHVVELKMLRRSAATADSAFVDGRSAADASTNLSEMVRDICRGNDVMIEALRVMAPSADKDIERVAVGVTFRASLEGLMSVVSTIEAGLPILIIRELSVEQPASALTRRTIESLQVSMVVEGAVHPASRGDIR